MVTFEVNDEQECFTRPWLEGAPYPARVEMVVGDVFELLPPRGWILMWRLLMLTSVSMWRITNC